MKIYSPKIKACRDVLSTSDKINTLLRRVQHARWCILKIGLIGAIYSPKSDF